MRIGLVIDVSTDVSADFLAAHGVHVLPSTLVLADRRVDCGRDPEAGLRFYQHELPRMGRRAQTRPLAPETVERLFLERWVVDYDYVFVITLSSARSETFDIAHQASFRILERYQRIRAAHHLDAPFALRVLDSESVFSGPAVLAWEAQRLIEAGRPALEIRRHLDDLVPHLHVDLVPDDLRAVWHGARQRGERSVAWHRYCLGRLLQIKPLIHIHRNQSVILARRRRSSEAMVNLFHHAAAQIGQGLLVPMMGISFGGDPAVIETLPGYQVLADAARQHNVTVMHAMMSPAAAINVGGGAIALAYCAHQRAAK